MLHPWLEAYKSHPMVLVVGRAVDRLARILAVAPTLIVLGRYPKSSHLESSDAVQIESGKFGHQPMRIELEEPKNTVI